MKQLYKTGFDFLVAIHYKIAKMLSRKRKVKENKKNARSSFL